MDLSSKVLGSNTVDKLTKSRTEAVVSIGSDTLTREQLANQGCYNFMAAKRLSENLKALGVKNLRDLFENYPPKDIALPHVGVISLAVLGAAFEAKRIGGESPLEAYVRRHSTKVVTFHTIKEQVKHAEEATRKPRKRRRTL